MKIKSINNSKIQNFKKPSELDARVYGTVLKSNLNKEYLIEAIKIIVLALSFLILIVMALATMIFNKMVNETCIAYIVLIVAFLILIIKQSFIVKKLYLTKEAFKISGFTMADCLGSVTKDGKTLSLKNMDGSSCDTIVKLKTDSKYIDSDGTNIKLIVLHVDSTNYSYITSRTNVDE